MHYQEFYYWCRDAVSKIKYTPDRDKVYTELYTHLEDRYESFLAQGFNTKEAEQKALAAMGDAKELAPQLAAIHKPYWGYAVVFTRFLVGVLCFLTLGAAVNFFHDLPYLLDKELEWGFEQAELINSVELNVSDSSDGYTFRVMDAKVYRVELPEEIDGKDYYDNILVRLKVTNPLPWALEQKVLYHIWAVDNFGNRYYNGIMDENREPGNGYISVMESRQGLTFYRYDLSLHDASTDVQWVELHYDRAGRDLVLRIDLTGGEHNVENS